MADIYRWKFTVNHALNECLILLQYIYQRNVVNMHQLYILSGLDDALCCWSKISFLNWSIIKGCTEHWWFVFVDLRYQTILKRVVGKLKFTLDFFYQFLRFYIQWKGRGTFPLRHRIEHTSIYPPDSVRAETKDQPTVICDAVDGRQTLILEFFPNLKASDH